MSAKPIALLSNLSHSGEDELIASLAVAMSSEAVVRASEMTPSQLESVEIAIVSNPDPAKLALMPNLVWIQSLSAGVERLVAAVGPAGPAITRLIDPEMARTMAESVLAWTHYIQRDMPLYLRQQRSRVWRKQTYREPKQTTVGIVGFGALGAAAAQRLRCSGFNVGGWSRSAKATVDGITMFTGECGLSRMLSVSDIVVCLLPLTAETRGLLDASRLESMKTGSALINFARGPIVVTEDLVNALDNNHLSHAVLDVFDEEPLQALSPLWSHPNITILPHITGPTNIQTAASIVAQNVSSYRSSGVVPRSVDRSAGY